MPTFELERATSFDAGLRWAVAEARAILHKVVNATQGASIFSNLASGWQVVARAQAATTPSAGTLAELWIGDHKFNLELNGSV